MWLVCLCLVVEHMCLCTCMIVDHFTKFCFRQKGKKNKSTCLHSYERYFGDSHINVDTIFGL